MPWQAKAGPEVSSTCLSKEGRFPGTDSAFVCPSSFQCFNTNALCGHVHTGAFYYSSVKF